MKHTENIVSEMSENIERPLTKYEKKVDWINKLYCNGFYDILDISRILKIDPEHLIKLMLKENIVYSKKTIGGYSIYKLFNHIEKRLQLIENRMTEYENANENNEDFEYPEEEDYEDDVETETDADAEVEVEENEVDEENVIQTTNDVFVKLYNNLFDDDDDDDDDEEKNETKTENNEQEIDTFKENSSLSNFSQIKNNLNINNIVFFSGLLFNITFAVIGFTYFCKNTTSHV
jgi:phage antirepressor YoqD-like protein